MAKKIDSSKLDRIHEAVIALIVEKGYGGASIASIAGRAGVAEGYLYRFYESKQELVRSLLHEIINQLVVKLEDLLQDYNNLPTVTDLLVDEIFQLAGNSPDEIKFIHVLMHDYNFQISDQQRTQIKELCNRLITLGNEKNELYPGTTTEEIFNTTIIYPIEFINLRLKGFFGSTTWDSHDKLKVKEFIVRALCQKHTIK